MVQTGDEATDDDGGRDESEGLWEHVHTSVEERGVSDSDEVERGVVEAAVELDMLVMLVKRRKTCCSPVSLG